MTPTERTTVSQYIRMQLLNQAQQVAFQRVLSEIVSELREEADVTLFLENL